MERRCTDTQETECSRCKPGFYNEAVNYEPCKPCTQCNQREPRPVPRPRLALPRGAAGALLCLGSHEEPRPPTGVGGRLHMAWWGPSPGVPSRL